MGLLHASLLATTTTTTSAFGPAPSFGAETARRTAEAPRPLRMSYYDMSDYGKADYEKEDEGGTAAEKALYQASLSEGGGDGEVKLELPPPPVQECGQRLHRHHLRQLDGLQGRREEGLGGSHGRPRRAHRRPRPVVPRGQPLQ